MFTNGSLHTDADHINEFQARWQYQRPNFMCLSENSGRYFTQVSDTEPERLWLPEGSEQEEFIMLSDHNRSTAPFSTERIGSRKRMINADMRSYFVADKLSLTISWDSIPSRAYSTLGGYRDWIKDPNECAKFTVDGGAGGVEMLNWHNAHKGSMWVFLSFDGAPSENVNPDVIFKGYSRVYEVLITDFGYDVVRRSSGYPIRGGSEKLYLDLWNVSMTLEEV